MANTIKYDSFFTDIITDNKGVSVCDINAGLNNLYKYFNENASQFEEVQRYYVPEPEAGYPDLVAYKSVLGSQDYWWWVLLLNRQDDGYHGLKSNWVYSINSNTQIDTFIQNSTSADEASNDDRIGSIVELN